MTDGIAQTILVAAGNRWSGLRSPRVTSKIMNNEKHTSSQDGLDEIPRCILADLYLAIG